LKNKVRFFIIYFLALRDFWWKSPIKMKLVFKTWVKKKESFENSEGEIFTYIMESATEISSGIY